MKKIYSFLTLMLLFMTGSVSLFAQEEEQELKWEISDEPVTEIRSGMTVVLQQGMNSGWSSNGYMNPSGEFKSEMDATCVYEILEVGTADDGATLYVLKNVSNKQYIYSGGHTLSYSDAFQCSIMKAVENSDNVREKISSDKQSGAAGVAWVFASKDLDEDGSPTYLCYWSCPAYSPYWDTNDWMVYEATGHEMSSMEKLEAAYNAIFGKGFSEDLFPVGTNPGFISQEVFNQLQAAYNAADAVMGQSNPSDEEVDAATAQVKAATKAYEEGLIPVVAGKYYIFVNQRTQDAAYDGGTNFSCTQAKSALEDPATASDAQYIWTLEDAGDNMFYIKNFSTARYVGASSGTSSPYVMSSTASMKFSLEIYSGYLFNIKDQSGNVTHNDGSYKVVIWNDASAEGGLWLIKEVSADVISQLSDIVEKNRFMSEYKSLIDEAKAVTEKYRYDSEVTFDSDFSAEGLVTAMTGNRTEPNEGSIEGAFDNAFDTYYHTNWSSSDAFDDYDWVQVDLGKEVSSLFIKFSKRSAGQYGGDPTLISLVAPADGDDPAAAWSDTLVTDTVIYEYATAFSSSSTVANSTAILKFDFDHAVQNLRFVVKKTKTNQYYGGKSPCWHVSELRFYNIEGENPRYTLVPQEIKDGLAEAIARAETLAADSSATQADYEALEAAIKAFEDAYPDDSELTALVAEAKAQAEAEGMVGTEWGYFAEGAQAELSAAVTAVEEKMAGSSALTLAQIAECLADLRSAIATFNSKLNVPEDGAIIRIKSETVTGEGEPGAANGNFIYATSADTVANINWGYADDDNVETRLNAEWQVIKHDDGTFSLRNLATGRYFGNVYTGAEDNSEISLSQGVKSAVEPQRVNFVSAKQPGMFDIQLAEGYYINADPSGAIVNWNDGSGNSIFSFVDRSDLAIDTYTYNVKANTLQIVTLPIAISFVDQPIYRVLGQMDGKLQLAEYANDETIPAGMPFIVQTDEDVNFLQIGLEATTPEELLNGNYVYESLEQNGMFGTHYALTVKAGLGLLLDGVVKNSVNNTAIAAGSGFFKEIPETTEDGDLAIDIQDVINGIGTVETQANAAVDVYTLSGVKVRSNVKGADATNGLPNGLYIVGGKKVLVK